MFNLISSFISNLIKVFILIVKGTKFVSPSTVDLRGNLLVGSNVSIGRNLTVIGEVTLGNNVIIEEACTLISCKVLNSAHIKSNTIIEGGTIGKRSFVGPFSRIRGNSIIKEDCQIGNFVEVKSSNIDSGCRINHMAFIGDTDMGKNVTVGAGVITCNHDGNENQKTVISKGAYIGSNSNLIAPLKIGLNVTIGSGSTIDKDVQDNNLAIARSKQLIIPNWKKRKN